MHRDSAEQEIRRVGLLPAERMLHLILQLRAD